MKKLSILSIGLVSMLMAGCGQSGNLYLPSPEARKARPHDTFILKTKTDSTQKNTSSDQTKQRQ